MRLLTQNEANNVAGGGYWATECDIFGCYSVYVTEEVWVPGYWDIYDVVDCGLFGCYSYTVEEYVPGYWAYV
ncbi:MAG: hypothetical protein CMF48_04610 [Legionellales bacterium]|nr:hypothetical protein [Legionellales bacterium]|tara:strand:+ start:484 stop:699 length:216 start_codon:yes stop_codon:yes gene_type:complete